MVQFNKHSGYVKGMSFSPLNKLLMCSVGLDRQIIFYDIHEQLIVKKITAPFPIQSVNFSPDGHTLAVGSSMNGQNQQCIVYDLRKSSSITLALQGHQSAVNCIRFSNKYDKKIETKPQKTQSIVNDRKNEMKTIEQIREEAKQNIEKRIKQQEEEQKQINKVMTMEQKKSSIEPSSQRQSQKGGGPFDYKQSEPNIG